RKALRRLFGSDIKLHAIAGRDDHRLPHARRSPELRGERRDFPIWDGKFFSQFHRSGVVAEAEAENLHDAQRPPVSVTKVIPESVSSATLNAATESQAARRGLN